MTRLRWTTVYRAIRWHVNFVVTTSNTILLQNLIVTHLVTKFSAICWSRTVTAWSYDPTIRVNNSWTKSPSWQVFLQLVIKFRVVYGNVHCRDHKNPIPILSQIIQVYAFLKMYFNIIFPSTPKFLKWTLSFRFPRQKAACILLLSHTNHPSHSPGFDKPNIYHSEEAKSWSSSLYNFLQFPVRSSLLGLNMFLSTLLPNTNSLFSPPLIWETKFHTHTEQKTKIVLN